MKTLRLAILVVFSAFALAALGIQANAITVAVSNVCPNLAGTYVNCHATAMAAIFPSTIQIGQNGNDYQVAETFSDGTGSNSQVIPGAPPVSETYNDPQVGKIITTSQTLCEKGQLVTNVTSVQQGQTFYENTIMSPTAAGLQLQMWLAEPNPHPTSAPDAVLTCSRY